MNEPILDIEVVRRKATVDLPAVAEAMVIEPFDEAAKSKANEILKGIKTLFGWIDRLCNDSIDAAKDSLAKAKKVKADLADPATRSDAIIRAKLKEAMRLEDVERDRRAKEEREAKDKAERDRKASEKALTDLIGDPAQAAAMAPVVQPARPSLPPLPEAAPGGAKRWKARVINPKLVPQEFTIPDQVALNKYATANKEAAVGTVPGVEFYSERDARIY